MVEKKKLMDKLLSNKVWKIKPFKNLKLKVLIGEKYVCEVVFEVVQVNKYDLKFNIRESDNT